jgi:hypothetical protein
LHKLKNRFAESVVFSARIIKTNKEGNDFFIPGSFKIDISGSHERNCIPFILAV